EALVLGVELLLPELPEAQGGRLRPEADHLRPERLPVEVGRPERDRSAMQPGRPRLERRRHEGDAVGQPQAVTGTGVLDGEERDPAEEHDHQQRVPAIPDEELEHGPPALTSGSRPSSGGPARPAPFPSRGPRRKADRRPRGWADWSPAAGGGPGPSRGRRLR